MAELSIRPSSLDKLLSFRRKEYLPKRKINFVNRRQLSDVYVSRLRDAYGKMEEHGVIDAAEALQKQMQKQRKGINFTLGVLSDGTVEFSTRFDGQSVQTIGEPKQTVMRSEGSPVLRSKGVRVLLHRNGNVDYEYMEGSRDDTGEKKPEGGGWSRLPNDETIRNPLDVFLAAPEKSSPYFESRQEGKKVTLSNGNSVVIVVS